MYVFFFGGGAFVSLFLLTNLVSVSLVGCNFAHAGASLSLCVCVCVCLSLRHNFSLDPCISVCIVFFFSLISPPFPRNFCVSIGRAQRDSCVRLGGEGRKEDIYTHTERERERERERRGERG